MPRTCGALCKELILGDSELGPLMNQPGDQREGGSFVASWESRTRKPFRACPPQPAFSFVKDKLWYQNLPKIPSCLSPLCRSLGG